MQYSTNLINTIVTYVNEEIAMTDVFQAIRSYEVKNLPVPIKQTYLAFSPKENTVTLFEDDNEEFCQKNNITVRMNCYTPVSSSTPYIYSLLEIVADALNDSFGGDMQSFTLGEIEFDSNVNAYKITSYLYFSYEVCAGEGSLNGSLSSSRTYYCQTHLKDTASHLTAEDRTYLDEPVVTGTYVGTGTSKSASVYLGFMPSALIIFKPDTHPATYKKSAPLLSNFCGFASPSGASRGITLYDGGFMAKQFESYATDESNTYLNNEGETYVYIAFR